MHGDITCSSLSTPSEEQINTRQKRNCFYTRDTSHVLHMLRAEPDRATSAWFNRVNTTPEPSTADHCGRGSPLPSPLQHNSAAECGAPTATSITHSASSVHPQHWHHRANINVPSLTSHLLLLLLHPFNGLFSRTTWVSRHQKGKQLWILLQWEMMGKHCYQLDHMLIICTSLQTDNHASTSSPSHKSFNGWSMTSSEWFPWVASGTVFGCTQI